MTGPKPTKADLQAAIGREQLKKVPSFVEARRRNWATMREHMERYEEFFILPEKTDWMEPSPFGLVLTVREDAPFEKIDITNFLEEKKIQTRGLFAGNILRHPAYETIDCRVAMPLVHSDTVTLATFFVGVYPGIDDARRDYILAMFDQFLARYGAGALARRLAALALLPELRGELCLSHMCICVPNA